MNGINIAKQSLDCAAAAKLIRKDLKAAFPGVKFSVTSSRFSMGSSVSVSYTNGPLRANVEAIVEAYGGKGFDGMTDSSYQNEGSLRMTVDGPAIVQTHAWLSVSRSYSDEARAAAKRHVALGWMPKRAQGSAYSYDAEELANIMLASTAF